nr:LOW QUALITY PROTEIN: uncharacterized protein LOC110379538 [Helicoverpa armigera]
MNNHNNYFVIVLLLFSSCLCEIINLSNNQREKFLTGFVEHYNSLPNQIYQSNEGILRSVQQVDDITFIIVAEIKATEIRDVEAFKKLECTATVQESGDDDVTVINHVCQELVPSTTPESTEDYRDTETQVEVTEGTVTSRHVQLENEVQSDTAVTSGEQFIAIPRDQPSSPCVGCTSHVNPQAPGVSDLAALGVRHLDLHEPSVNHSLDTVIDVERQVQVRNGVRYILTLLINSNNCTDVQTENCNFPKTCKVTILVKPWIKLPNGQNHRSILANNCTEPWLYGSDGEVLPEPSGDDIQVRHHTDVQSVPNQERTLTEQELLSIQEQIIPNSEFKVPTASTRSFDATSNTLDVSKQHVFKVESNKQTENSVPVTESEKKEQQSFNTNLDTDKKKAIDDMLDFFDFSGFKPKTETEDVISRVRRSYDDDLQVLSLAKDYHGIKNSIENARFMYEMAQVMVDYLNEMDMEVKNRAVKDVVKAEDETENLQRFVYIQARVTIPCDKVECRPTDVVTQICNGVIDSTNVNSPQILNTFCYNENKERDFREVVREVPLDDPILKNLAEEALKKIETESKSKHAMKISKIVSANTQLTSGTLTKFSVIIENINCEKSVPLLLRMNCTVLQQPGSKICEVIVHERRWLNERKISYTCTDRPVEMRISKSTSITNNVTVDDPKVVEMLQEAIQYLETQSVKNNKQKIVNINSISSQIIAGFLTKIEFVVGYTNCTDESKTRDNAFQKCEVLKDEALRLCKAQIWDRSWIMDGRQVEVSCDDVLKSNEVQSARNKRSIDSIGGSVRRSGSKDGQIDYKKLAEDALQKFMLTSANRQHYVVLKVEKVKTQDEPGKLTKIIFFHLTYKLFYSTRWAIVIAQMYYQLAEESLKKYMQNTEHTQNHKVVRLEKVTTQIVSGLLTNIDFIISPITQDGISNKTIKCHSKILEKQWLGKKDFNVSCQLKYQKENQKKNLKNPKYMQMAVEALEKYIQNKPESDLLRVTFVDKVEEGEGKSFNIRFMASHNEDDDGDTLCYVQFPETQIPKKNMNVECHSIGTVLKQIQITEDDPKFIKYVQWAEESLNDYLQNMNSSQLYTIVRIESVNVLWDDSVKTLINFIISPIDLEYSALQGKMCQAEIKEQPWLNKKSKNVKCEPDEELYRAKRQVPGGETEKDPKDPAYMELAKQSLRKYLLENPRITQSSEVDPVVERVTTQVVAGSMTRIDFHFQASGTDSQQDHVTMKCHAEVWERKWLNSKEITVTCSEVKAKVRRDLSGEITEQDPKNPHYMDLAEQSLRKYLLDNPQGTPALEVALVEKVTTQGKSGSLTRIDFLVLSRNDPITMFCNSEVSEQPSLNKVDIKVSCPKIFKTSLAGGLTLQDPSKPEYKLLAVESLQKYVRESEYTDVYEVTSVDKVTSQVVAGSLTRINFQATSSQTGKAMKCHSAIVEQPWLNVKNVNVSCYKADQRQRRSLPGGETEKDPKDPAYMELAKQSLRKYLLENPRITQSSEVDPVVERVTTQVVAGSMTRIDFHFQASGTDSQQDHFTMKCHAEIWERKWLNSKEITVSCSEVKAKVRRDLSGDITELDPKNPHYMDLAEQSLRKYLLDNPQGTPALEVALVEKVTTQGKSGSLTRIDFLVLSRNDPITMFCNSEVSEQPSLNKVDIKVSCPKIFKTSLAGGLTLQDPSKPEYKLLAVESLQKYVRESEYTDVYEVTSVDKVTSQVVAGSLTRINFQATSSQTGKAMKCHSAIVEQPWLNVKNVNVSCYKADQRQRRSLPGGETEKDPKDPAYMELAKQSLRKYLLENPRITQSSEVDPVVERVTTQVVAGSMTRIDFHFQASGTDSQQDHFTMKCHAEIWERKWLNSKEITVSCSESLQKYRQRRSLPGGETEKDPKDPAYMELAKQSLRKYLLENPRITQSSEVDPVVERVTTQVVAGSMTRIDFHFQASGTDSQQDHVTMKCHAEIWERKWLNSKEITVSCSESLQKYRQRRSLPGGETEKDPKDPAYMELAKQSLRKYLLENPRITQSSEVDPVVERVTTQVVAGSMTRIDFHFQASGTDSQQDHVTMKCHAEVWERKWLNSKEITVSCSEVKAKVRRDLSLEITEQDPKNPHYMDLAEQSLRKYLLDNPQGTPALEVALVEKVTTQGKSGSPTRIDFLVLSRNDPITMFCNSEVSEQPSLNKVDIKVSCPKIFKTSLAGGLTLQDPSKPEYKLLAVESLQKYVRESEYTDVYEVTSVDKVTSQVVAGSLTRINFQATSSQTGKAMKCHSAIVEQPWLNVKSVNVSCYKANQQRQRRSLPGGETEKDPKDPAYMELAKQSLRKYLLENPRITQSSEVDPVVERVTTQVVAGSMTRIDFHFQASGTDSQQDHVTMKCHAEVWERPWLEPKAEFSVSCANADKRVKRHLKVPSHSMKHNSVALNYEVLDDEKNGNQKERDHVSSLRGHTEEVKDPSQPEYKILAEEALRKYELKSTVYHKVVEVKRVVTRVVSGLKYYINFNAAPTTCLLNVTSARARSCKPVADVILYCHTEIWDRPWLKRKKIDVNCYADDSEDSDIDLSSKPANANNNSSEIYLKLAEEASEKYLTTSNRKYVHKVTEILSGSEQVANGSLITIVFSLSPTTCLRNDTTKKSCNLKQPLVVFHCSAEIRNRSSLEHEKEIEVTCKKRSEEKNKKEKRDIGTRHTRQTGDDDDEIDEETTFYYADRAIQHMNDNSNSNNLHKLISIHGVQSGIQMGTVTVQMYLEVAETFCLRHNRRTDLKNCEEMNGLNHRLCLARLWPSPDDELVVRHVTVVCDDDENFESITGVNIPELLKMSIAALERPPEAKYKLVHQGEPQVIPSLDSKFPFKLNFVVATTNCSKDVNLDTNPFQCYINTEIPAKSCHSFIWLETATKYIRYISAKCTPLNRVRRSSLDLANMTIDNSGIQRMVQASLEKLEMTSLHRYKQRVLQINSYSTKITSGKVTTIDFDVGYTSCLKYEWVANITSCDFLEHLPRRRCVAQIWERLWINNGQNIDVSCVDDETPLEAHIEFESAEMANELAREALKHIEAKYPHPNKQKVVRIFSLEKQVVAGIHYKMKVEVGFTDCVALSDQTDCKLLKDQIMNRFCRVNVWVRPWTDHPPNFRVSCDFQEATTYDLYHHVQAEHLFYNFLTTYNPSYVNDYSQMQKRFEIFKQNIKKIHELNVHEKGTAMYGVTRFADLSYEEFRSTYMGLKTNLTNENQVPMKMADIPDIKVPVNFDWREYDAVTDVKDQGSCGSCWAFSVTGNIEGQWKMQSGKLVSLSEQELVDCDKMDDGCNGGLPDNAYRAIEQMGGLELESDYPYEGVDEKCAFNKTLAKVQISGAVNITKNETGMAQWLVHNGPISIGINANAMQFYMGGISHPWKMLCNPTNLDHGVLIVGYGIKDYPLFHKKLPYWIVKNSWGKSWGEQGYYRVYRGDGTCGVNQMASSAVI